MFGCLSRKLELEAYLMLSLRLVISWWSDRAELQLRAGMGACLCSPSAYNRSSAIDNFMEICSVGAARHSLRYSKLRKCHGKENNMRRRKCRRKLMHGVFLWARFCLIKVMKRNGCSPVDGGARSEGNRTWRMNWCRGFGYGCLRAGEWEAGKVNILNRCMRKCCVVGYFVFHIRVASPFCFVSAFGFSTSTLFIPFKK